MLFYFGCIQYYCGDQPALSTWKPRWLVVGSDMAWQAGGMNQRNDRLVELELVSSDSSCQLSQIQAVTAAACQLPIQHSALLYTVDFFQ